MWRVTGVRGAEEGELDRTVAALTTVQAPDGQRYRIRVLAPGEPRRGEGSFATLSIALHWLSRGLLALGAPTSGWVVLVQRQRGPWRGFETLRTASFAQIAEAERHAQRARVALERGEPMP